jgi:diadenylate cyclase
MDGRAARRRTGGPGPGGRAASGPFRERLVSTTPLPLNASETPLKELIDIALMAGLVYGVRAWLRHTTAQLALVGVSTLGGIYLLARHAGLVLTAWALQGFVAVGALLLIVVFQADLRRGLERLALPLLGRRRDPAPADVQQSLLRAVVQLAAARRGALVVLPGREVIDRHVEGGVGLGGAVSEPLLLSLFDPNSAGHDGAVVVEGGVVTRFAVHLPLSSDFAQLGARGTRHAAALGLAERCDALVLVVSEERGSICVAHEGRLEELQNPSEVRTVLRDFQSRSAGAAGGPERWPALRRNVGDLLLALGISTVLWVAVVPGSEVTETVVRVRVAVQDVPPGYVLEKVDPEEVTVTASGPRRTLLLSGPADFELDVDAILVQLGRRTFEVDSGDVKHPAGVHVLSVEPDRIQLSVRAAPGAGATPAPSPPSEAAGPGRPSASAPAEQPQPHREREDAPRRHQQQPGALAGQARSLQGHRP